MVFSLNDGHIEEIKQIICLVYLALKKKGYNPIDQIVGYILSEDPTYITTYKNARNLIRKVDRHELLRLIVKSFLEDGSKTIENDKKHC
jgi:uncharacterized protein (UPF0297 family)